MTPTQAIRRLHSDLQWRVENTNLPAAQVNELNAAIQTLAKAIDTKHEGVPIELFGWGDELCKELDAMGPEWVRILAGKLKQEGNGILTLRDLDFARNWVINQKARISMECTLAELAMNIYSKQVDIPAQSFLNDNPTKAFREALAQIQEQKEVDLDELADEIFQELKQRYPL